jgi:uncharacterized protein involved in exopolysaccharide biosynthesis
MRPSLHDAAHAAAGSQREPEPDGDELSIRDIAEPLWRHHWLILGVAVICGVVAVFVAKSHARRYEGVAVVRVAESKSGDTAEQAKAENYRPLFENKTIAASLVKDFNLKTEAQYVWQSDGGPIAPDEFLRDILDVDLIAGTNLMRVRVKLADPDAAAKVTNALVERAVDLNRRINQQEVVDARDYIKSQLEDATRRVDQVRDRYVALKQHSQVDALRKDAEGELDLRSKLMKLQSEIAGERAFLARSEGDLKASQRLLTTRRSIDRDPALMEVAKERGATGANGSVLGLGLTEEQVNEAYSALEKQVSESGAKLAGLEGQRKLLVDVKGLDRASLPVLTKLYEGDVAVERLKAEYDMALKVYTDLSLRYEDARIRVGGRGAQIQLVDPAIRPSRALAQRAGSSAVLAALGGALVASAVLLGRWALRRWPLTRAA